MTRCKLDGHILLVQISANIILVLSETSVIFSEAETCSNLEREEKKENKKTQHFLNVSKAPSENDILSNTAFFFNVMINQKYILDYQCTKLNIWLSRHNPSDRLQRQRI